MIEIIGWIGCFCFAFCALPQVILCIKTKKADFSIAFLFLWLLGEICYIISVLTQLGLVYWLLINYVCNIFFVLIIIYYKVFK